MINQNDLQIGGDHYKVPGQTEHWDFVWQHNLDYFQGQITKYVVRWKKKGGLRDLHKARHFLDKYIQLIEGSQEKEVNEKQREFEKMVAAAAQPQQGIPRPTYDTPPWNRST